MRSGRGRGIETGAAAAAGSSRGPRRERAGGTRARRCWRQVLALDSRNGRARRALACAELDAGRPREALRWLQGARRAAADPEGLLALGRARLALGRLRLAERPLRDAFLTQPGAETALALEEVLDRLGRRLEGIAVLRAALVRDPDRPELRRRLGSALRVRGRHLEAERQLRCALAADPRDAAGWAELGGVLVDRARYTEGRRVLRRALRLDPAPATALGDLARACWCLRRLKEAEAAFREWVARRPRCAAAHVGLGDFLSRERSSARTAERSLRAALALDPRDRRAQHCLGMHLLRVGRVAEARRELMRAARRGHPPAQNVLAGLHARGEGGRRDVRRALVWLRRAVAGGDAEAQFRLGLRYDLGDGLDRDPALAAQLYARSAAAGIAAAQYNLALLYGAGVGVERDEARAAFWYARAAVASASPRTRSARATGSRRPLGAVTPTPSTTSVCSTTPGSSVRATWSSRVAGSNGPLARAATVRSSIWACCTRRAMASSGTFAARAGSTPALLRATTPPPSITSD
jgi:tetratricopeptide (TPR) repeat protein